MPHSGMLVLPEGSVILSNRAYLLIGCLYFTWALVPCQGAELAPPGYLPLFNDSLSVLFSLFRFKKIHKFHRRSVAFIVLSLIQVHVFPQAPYYLQMNLLLCTMAD